MPGLMLDSVSFEKVRFYEEAVSAACLTILCVLPLTILVRKSKSRVESGHIDKKREAS